MVQPRVALALLGGSPVPGTASTLGMRIGSFPRLSFSGRLSVVPMEIPPLVDRSDGEGTGALMAGLSGQATVGLLTGWSPLPTVGGLFSLDLIARASWASLPEEKGFRDGSVWGWSAGLRLGALRESFTLPGISLTGSYGRTGHVALGDPRGAGAYIDGAIADWNATLAASKRIGPVGVTAGVAWDRYTSEVDFAFPGPGSVPGEQVQVQDVADATTERWSAFTNVSWTFLIAHGSLEAGWQEAPVPDGLPSDVTVDPAGWWVGAALRLSI